ncbi:proton-conducting transporter membrane subunit [Legionella anisa]|uniref:proton-conducting transporter transmembrane domain-containing protein n=1 Tax=Legionella anisa TaxID=28082 RepID=UPI0003784716|nr:proton-conducting transporter membrane subunit [Legionella anisa]KTC67480.1 NADH-ubiquinone oxidoreductase chain 5 [Legionella anisa]MCW8423915.1 proton-conducting transporter membrane subunit [Legionella anisa]MCW8447437.1 proton-conducting transporter membrane subunit [Legionella anisa]
MNTIVLIFLYLMLACPLIALAFNYVLISRPIVAARLAGYCVGFGFLMGVGLLFYLSLSQNPTVYWLITLNALSLLLCSLVLLVSFVVHRFSLRYMYGDRLYRRFFLLLSALTLTALLMVLADNLFLFWGAWSVSNLFLVLLMAHKKEWAASKNSALLAFYTLASGSACLLVALILLSFTYSTNSIETLTQLSNPARLLLVPLSMGLILVAALTQSGLFPFHRWLLSSLNSPTPVSALMHAGLVNGGGILIVKFAPLMMLYPGLLSVLFIFGSISALVGTVWKLMQHDIKKMLACSTMAQMGFMMMQCGVGLFAAAIAHLCWHGLFKAYLFLSSGSAVKQKKSDTHSSRASFMMLITSLAGGAVAMIAFAFVTHKSMAAYDASAFVLFFAFIAGSQLMLTWIRVHPTVLSLVSGLIFALLSGLMYGASIELIQRLIPSISTLQAPQLSIIHWTIMILFGALWAVFNLGVQQTLGQSKLGCWLYMSLFNSSQPSRKTVTTLRNDYNY